MAPLLPWTYGRETKAMKKTAAISWVLLAALATAPAAPDPVQAPEQQAERVTVQEAVQDEGGERTDKPEVVVPLSSRRVQIEVLGEGWKIKRAAREFGRQIDGLRIFTRGTCDDRPRAVCIRVISGSWSDEEQLWISGGHASDWYALTTYPKRGLREIYLDNGSEPTNPRACAAHELAHALGLGHHDGLGVVGRSPDVLTLSGEERRALSATY